MQTIFLENKYFNNYLFFNLNKKIHITKKNHYYYSLIFNCKFKLYLNDKEITT